MKKIIFIAGCIAVFGLIFIFAAMNQANKTAAASGLLRIHVRANSNSTADQTIKLAVKDKIVEYLTPQLTEAKTAKKAMSIINDNLDAISLLATSVLKAQGFNYGARARLANEYFPTRVYDTTVLENGYYDALIIELGSAAGDNWWCVVYPPLCFVGAQNPNGNVVYKSKLYEIIKAWKAK